MRHSPVLPLGHLALGALLVLPPTTVAGGAGDDAGALAVSADQRLASASARPTAAEPEPEQEGYYDSNDQLGLGLGVAAYGFFVGSDWPGASLLSGDTVLLNLVVNYRYRVNARFAGGGGALVFFVPGADAPVGGGAATGGLRVYLHPDYVYVDASLLAGFPIFVGGVFGFGFALPVGSALSIMLESQVVLGWSGFPVGFGFWQPVLGLEFGL